VADGGEPPLGLVAGCGELPLAVARAARRRGRPVAAVAFHGHTDPALEARARVTWLDVGQVGAALDALERAGVEEAVLAGKVPKTGLFPGPGNLRPNAALRPHAALQPDASLRPDATGRELLATLRDRRDLSILRAVAALLASRGIRLLPQARLVPELLGAEGTLGRCAPSPAQRADVALGFAVAKRVAGLDVGQTVVVKDGAVIAVEALEGTDAAIRRAGALVAGACVVKVARPGQDPRFDLPTLGPGTLRAAREARAAVLAFEAGQTLVLRARELAREADACGIALLGVRSGAADARSGELR
jgi:DUF1009 family protein